jgi:hypothetical protein
MPGFNLWIAAFPRLTLKGIHLFLELIKWNAEIFESL